MENKFKINCPDCGTECEASEDDNEVNFQCDVCEEETTLFKDSSFYAQFLAQGVAKARSTSAKK